VLIYLAFHSICWLIPIAIIVPILLLHKMIAYTDKGKLSWCSLDETWSWYVWVGPLTFSFFFNMIFYFLILLKFYCKFKATMPFIKRQKELSSAVQRRITLYIIAFLLCWWPDIVSHVREFIVGTHCNLTWLFYLTVIFSPLQGFLNFLVYGFTNRNVFGKYAILGRPESSNTAKSKPVNSTENNALLIKEHGSYGKILAASAYGGTKSPVVYKVIAPNESAINIEE